MDKTICDGCFGAAAGDCDGCNRRGDDGSVRVMRDRKTSKRDSQQHYGGLEQHTDAKALEAFKRPAYMAGELIREQGQQIRRVSVAEYVADKYGIERGDAGGQEKADAVQGTPEGGTQAGSGH